MPVGFLFHAFDGWLPKGSSRSPKVVGDKSKGCAPQVQRLSGRSPKVVNGSFFALLDKASMTRQSPVGHRDVRTAGRKGGGDTDKMAVSEGVADEACPRA